MSQMDDPSRRPSVPLNILAGFARGALWLMVVAWLVMLGSWGALHVFIVPRIDDWRGPLQAQASRLVGVPVRIGAIQAQADGLIPSFELRDVRLLDPQGQDALQLPRVLVALSPRSLWRAGLEQLYIDSPRLEIRRTREGRILVAGLDLSPATGGDSPVLDWLLTQTELALRGGTVQWIDESSGEGPVVFEQVDLVQRNTARTHSLRIDATPPPAWGQRLTLMGQFRQPLLSLHAGRWREWEGQTYAESTQIDLAQLRRYLPFALEVDRGQGAVRAWVDWQRGRWAGLTVDLALSEVQATLTPRLGALSFPMLTGRVGVRQLTGGLEFTTQNLQFELDDGLRWPGGNLRLQFLAATARAPAHGELQADRMDLAALARIARRLPLEAAVHEQLAALAPQGLVERLQASWEGDPASPTRFTAKGRVTALGWASTPPRPAPGVAYPLGRPGVSGATVDFDLSQAAGRATVAMQDGRLELPGLFEHPVVAVTQLASDVQWQRDGERWSVSLPNLKFSNADAQGEAQLKWQMTEGASLAERLPGVLELQGTLSRADASQVHRYLPLDVEREVREYLRDALTQGHASAVRFRLKGPLVDFPFSQPRQGEFKVSAQVRDAALTYVPKRLQAPGEPAWPALTHLQGEFMMDRASIWVKGSSGRVAGAPGLRLGRAEARIANVMQGAVLEAEGEAKGPLAEMIATVVNGSPLAELSGQVLREASANGAAEVQLKLRIPLLEVAKTTVQGKATLAGNEVQLAPTLPRLARMRGAVHFSETGFALQGVQARALGGDLKAEGGTIAVPGVRATGTPMLRVQGVVTAEGLRQARELGPLSQVAERLAGSTAYSFNLGLRRKVPEWQFSSTLQGLALNLPAPFNKPAETVLPLRAEAVLVSTPGAPTVLQDQLSLELGRLLSVVYVRDLSGSEPRVLRGAVGAGLAPGETVPLPTQGVVANLHLQAFDLDAWESVFRLTVPSGSGAAAQGGAFGPALGSSYLPTSVGLRAQDLSVGGRTLHQLVLGGSREGSLWRANLDARELSGYLEYRPPGGNQAGQLYARLARLVLAPSSVSDVESLLDEQPVSIPALDIVVDDLELRGKKLGRVEIEAINRGGRPNARDSGPREWRLNRFNVITPEAVFTATGNWALLGEPAARAPGTAAARAAAERRRTVMNFKLEIADAGELLTRFGMKDVVRRGKGRMEGQVAWAGSPLALDYPSLGGAFNVNVENGQFLKADPGIAKLLGVLSLQALPRRLALDFRDVFSDGFAFDFVRGDVRIEQGMASTNNLQMKGVNAAVLMDGRADMARETQDIKVVVVPEINAGTASLVATWINPAVGLGSFLAQLILRRPLIDSTTEQFQITGSWSDPKITRTDTPNAPAAPAPTPAPARNEVGR